jgi:hypothetical protein
LYLVVSLLFLTTYDAVEIRRGGGFHLPPTNFGNYLYLAILTNAIPKKVPQLLRGRIPVTPANHQFYVVPPVASTVFKVFWDFLGIIF